MSSLANQQQNLTYPGLLQIPGGITTALQQVQDGNGNPTGLSLSSSGASVTTSSTAVVSNDGTQLTGAIPRLISDMFGDILNINDFGADPTGVADSAPAIQAAIDALGINGGQVFVPAGIYKTLSTVTINYAGTFIRGCGRGTSGYGAGPPTTNTASLIYGVSINGAIIKFNAIGCGIQDITVRGAGMNALVNASAISFTTPTTANVYSLVDNVTVQNTYVGIDARNSALLTISKSQIFDCPYAGIAIANTLAPDTGDMVITDCLFIDANYQTSTHISQVSAGGLKISNCKMLFGAYGYYLALGAATNTVDLLISNCSIENYTGSAISLYAPSTSGSFFNVAITGCEFGTNEVTTNHLQINSTLSNFQVIAVTGCIFALGGATNAINIDDSRCVSITGNSFSGAGIGIYLSGTTDVVSIVGNSFQYCYGVTNGATGKNITIASNVSTVSSANVVAANPLVIPEDGSFFTITGSTAFSSIYNPSQRGRQVTLLFTGAPPVYPSATLLMPSTFNATANDTLTLVSNGTAWYEIARSVN